MKVALLFSGQLRKIPLDIFKNSLNILVEGLDYSIYSYCWEEIGDSMNHSKNIPLIYKSKNIGKEIDNIFNSFNLRRSSFESYTNYKKLLGSKYNKILTSSEFHKGTIHSLPQIYSLYKCHQLLEKEEDYLNYDLVFRCRYDSVFIHPLSLYPLKKIIEDNNIYNINFGRAFYPKRIYDIFFGGSREAMSFISSLWKDLPSLVENKFENNLDKRDACRILYLGPSLKDIKVKTFDVRICDVFRNSNDISYEKYIISSHFVKLFKILKYLKCWRYFFNHCNKRRISNIKIAFFIFKAFVLSPFSYIKRIKFFLKNLFV